MATLNIKNFPDRLYRRIKQRAGKNRRSISQEVVQLLDEAVTQPARVSLLELEGLGREVWEKALAGKDAAEYIAEERDAWS
ncbi:MAG TPA: Arc family DNA-binding protein [Thermoanaerobaculia bacterium]|jgi:plasmid stability protein|nr:Arc family DNA-binding protein [Thermoanaerobaculia bacterium]